MSIVARFPPYGGADPWIVKQALDMGLMGVVFNTVNTKEEAIAAVRSMRYPPQRNDPATQKGPVGMRGFAPGGALWNWGISGGEYQRRADLWPLNPNGDLLANLMIETREGGQEHRRDCVRARGRRHRGRRRRRPGERAGHREPGEFT